MKVYQFGVDDDAYRELERIRELTGANNHGEVIKTALALYEQLVKLAEQGNRVFIGKLVLAGTEELVVPALEKVRGR